MTTPPVGYNQDTNFYSGPSLSGADYAAGTNGTISYTMGGNISDMSGGATFYTPDSGFFSGGYGTFGGDSSAGLSYGSSYGGGLSYNDSSMSYYAPSGYSGGSFFGDTGYGGSSGGVSGGAYGDNTGYGSVGYHTDYRPPTTPPEPAEVPVPSGWVLAGPCNPGLYRSPDGRVYERSGNQWVLADHPDNPVPEPGYDPEVDPPMCGGDHPPL